MKKENKLVQSYYKEKYFISTAYRESSGGFGHWYYETIVWVFNKKTKERGKMLLIEDSGTEENGALLEHYNIMVKLQ